MSLRPPVPSARARAYLKKMTELQMQSQVHITRPGNPTFDPASGLTTAHTGSDVYTGPARVYPTQGALQAIGDGLVSIGQTSISIPQDAPLPKVDDIVDVVSTPDDSAMVDRRYRVIDVSEGGILSPSRSLTCTTVEGNPWSA